VRTLKVLVVVMGVMLVLGIAVLIVAIAGRSSRGPGPATSPPFAAPPIDLPHGSHLEAMSVGPDRLVVDVVQADGSRQLLIIELATGRRLGTVLLRTSP
jgi:hypothetical protein